MPPPTIPLYYRVSEYRVKAFISWGGEPASVRPTSIATQFVYCGCTSAGCQRQCATLEETSMVSSSGQLYMAPVNASRSTLHIHKASSHFHFHSPEAESEVYSGV
ncbi:hypothetical protein PTI98_010281 [Pleurotus ostreatus]|nr:hypothetical protein PTI98_010281 [Pleurotus ostreatus]